MGSPRCRWTIQRARSAEQRFHPGAELARPQRLDDVAVSPCLQSLQQVDLVAAHGDDHDVCAGERPDLLEHREAVATRHGQVQRDQARIVCPDGFERLGAVLRGDHVEAGGLEDLLKEFADVDLVIDNDGDAVARSPVHARDATTPEASPTGSC